MELLKCFLFLWNYLSAIYSYAITYVLSILMQLLMHYKFLCSYLCAIYSYAVTYVHRSIPLITSQPHLTSIMLLLISFIFVEKGTIKKLYIPLG